MAAATELADMDRFLLGSEDDHMDTQEANVKLSKMVHRLHDQTLTEKTVIVVVPSDSQESVSITESSPSIEAPHPPVAAPPPPQATKPAHLVAAMIRSFTATPATAAAVATNKKNSSSTSTKKIEITDARKAGIEILGKSEKVAFKNEKNSIKKYVRAEEFSDPEDEQERKKNMEAIGIMVSDNDSIIENSDDAMEMQEIEAHEAQIEAREKRKQEKKKKKKKKKHHRRHRKEDEDSDTISSTTTSSSAAVVVAAPSRLNRPAKRILEMLGKIDWENQEETLNAAIAKLREDAEGGDEILESFAFDHPNLTIRYSAVLFCAFQSILEKANLQLSWTTFYRSITQIIQELPNDIRESIEKVIQSREQTLQEFMEEITPHLKNDEIHRERFRMIFELLKFAWHAEKRKATSPDEPCILTGQTSCACLSVYDSTSLDPVNINVPGLQSDISIRFHVHDKEIHEAMSHIRIWLSFESRVFEELSKRVDLQVEKNKILNDLSEFTQDIAEKTKKRQSKKEVELHQKLQEWQVRWDKMPKMEDPSDIGLSYAIIESVAQRSFQSLLSRVMKPKEAIIVEIQEDEEEENSKKRKSDDDDVEDDDEEEDEERKHKKKKHKKEKKHKKHKKEKKHKKRKREESSEEEEEEEEDEK